MEAAARRISIRFTTKGATPYAIILASPDSGEVVIKSLGTSAELLDNQTHSAESPGSRESLQRARAANVLTLKLPGRGLCEHACAVEVTMKI